MSTKNIDGKVDDSVKYPATIVSNKRITPETSDEEVRELVLDVDCDEIPFMIGQSIGVVIPVDGEPAGSHVRLYTLADIPEENIDGRPRVSICVLRCVGQDGKGGLASNFLCDAKPGQTVEVTGPVGMPFDVPDQLDANLILIGTGTGIAPFRAFVKHLYRDVDGWTGRIWLFYGASTGLEKLFMNDKEADLARYVDKQTFEAFEALSPKPNWADPLSWDLAFAERGSELWEMMMDPKTYVYVAGLSRMSDGLDAIFSGLAGSEAAWAERKSELTEARRWVELLY